MQDSISLNKYISSAGICSRREADRMIDAGRVTINGKVAKKGNRVFDSDKVVVDGSPIKNKAKAVYLVLNKPPGITCTTDRKERDNIIDFMNYPKRIFPVGRLDKASSGLIILTNNGDIVNKILRVENKHEKEYVVTVDHPITGEFIEKMSKGVHIMGKRTKRCIVKKKFKNVFTIILTQGLNRQIRRMCEALNYKVLTLKRVRIMHIKLGSMKVGHWRELSADEMAILFKDIR